MSVVEQLAIDEARDRGRAPLLTRYAVVGSLGLALYFAVSHLLFPPQQLDVSAEQRTLATFTNPIAGSVAGEDAVYRDCADGACATVTRSFDVPAGLTLGQAMDQLDQWGIAQNRGVFDTELTCVSGDGQKSAEAPVGQCVVTLWNSNGNPVTLGFQFADPGYPADGEPWFNHSQLPIIGVVASVDNYALGHD